MGQSKTLPFYRLLLLWYFIPDGASSEYCFNDEDDSVQNCEWGCCESDTMKHCCISPYAIAGIVCGSIGGVCTIVALTICWRLYKKRHGQVVKNPQSQSVMVLSGNVPQQQYNGYNTSFSGNNSQYNSNQPPPYTQQANYPPAPPVPPAYTAATSQQTAYTYIPPASNPFAAAAGRTLTAK